MAASHQPIGEGDLSVLDRSGADPAVTTCTLHVCTTCRRARADLPEGYDKPGAALAAALEKRIEGSGAAIAVEAVECLSVCKRPCTVALSGEGKWTYVYGDLDPQDAVETLIAFAGQYRASPDGVVPWRERPEIIRKSVVARIPPLSTARPAR